MSPSNLGPESPDWTSDEATQVPGMGDLPGSNRAGSSDQLSLFNPNPIQDSEPVAEPSEEEWHYPESEKLQAQRGLVLVEERIRAGEPILPTSLDNRLIRDDPIDYARGAQERVLGSNKNIVKGSKGNQSAAERVAELKGRKDEIIAGSERARDRVIRNIARSYIDGLVEARTAQAKLDEAIAYANQYGSMRFVVLQERIASDNSLVDVLTDFAQQSDKELDPEQISISNLLGANLISGIQSKPSEIIRIATLAGKNAKTVEKYLEGKVARFNQAFVDSPIHLDYLEESRHQFEEPEEEPEPAQKSSAEDPTSANPSYLRGSINDPDVREQRGRQDGYGQ